MSNKKKFILLGVFITLILPLLLLAWTVILLGSVHSEQQWGCAMAMGFFGAVIFMIVLDAMK